MEKRLFCIKPGLILLLFSFAVVLSGCDSDKRYTGTYVAVSKEKPPRTETILELKDHATGVWKTKEREVPFRWSIKKNEIRFHTKEGGIITGKISKDVITLRLPNDKVMTLKKRK